MVKNFEDLKTEILAAVAKLDINNEKLANAPALPARGDLYVFSATAELGIEWALIRQHVDEPKLWFMVPFDQDPFAGTWDVAVSEFSDAGVGTLRCGRGIWIHTDDMGLGTRSGFLEADYVDDVTQRLAAMVHGEIVPGTHKPEVDEHPEYQEWIDEVTAAAERLEQLLLAEPEVISLADFSTTWTSVPGIRQPATALAAQDGGLGAGPAEPVEPLPASIIADNLPGKLVALKESNGLRLQHHPQAEESLDVVVAGDSVKWIALPGGAVQSAETFSYESDLCVTVANRNVYVKSDAKD